MSAQASRTGIRHPISEQWAVFLHALQFLTRLPVDLGERWSPARAARAVRYYPAVGVLVGLVAGGVLLGASLLFRNAVLGVVLATAVAAAFTGAFHEDGLADTFDGIGGGHTASASLEIMRDSRLGSYGALALMLVLASRVAALAALPTALAIAALITAHPASRLSAVITIATSRYVREEGTGKPVARGIDAASLAIALASTLAVLAAALWLSPALSATHLLAALGGGALGHGLGRLAFERKLGGYTGDCLGAVQQLTELGWYLGLAATWR